MFLAPPSSGVACNRMFEIRSVTGKDWFAMWLLPKPMRAMWFAKRSLKGLGGSGPYIFTIPNGEKYFLPGGDYREVRPAD